MAIVEIPGGAFLPAPIQWEDSGVPSFTNYTLNTTTRKISFILRAPRSGASEDEELERFEFMIGAAAQIPANGLKVSFQAVAAGAPVNSADYYYTIPIDDLNENRWVMPPYITSDGTDSGERMSVEHGQLFACVIEFENFSLGDSLTIQVISQDKYAMKGAYVLTSDILDAWTKVPGSPNMALVYKEQGAEDVYMPLMDAYAISDIILLDISSSTTPDEIGMQFTLLAPMRVGGAYVLVKPTGDFDVVLYDTETNTTLETVRVNTTDYYPNTHNVDYVYVRFAGADGISGDRLLDANKVYVLSVLPASTSAVVVYWVVVGFSGEAEQMASLPGGETLHYRSRVDAGDWEEIIYYRPLFGLHITGVDHDISGGSGGGGWEGNP